MAQRKYFWTVSLHPVREILFQDGNAGERGKSYVVNVSLKDGISDETFESVSI